MEYCLSGIHRFPLRLSLFQKGSPKAMKIRGTMQLSEAGLPAAQKRPAGQLSAMLIFLFTPSGHLLLTGQVHSARYGCNLCSACCRPIPVPYFRSRILLPGFFHTPFLRTSIFHAPSCRHRAPHPPSPVPQRPPHGGPCRPKSRWRR